MSQLLDPEMNKCMNEDMRDLFIYSTSSIGSVTTIGVGETQRQQLYSRKAETPLFISSLNGPTDMWGPKS